MTNTEILTIAQALTADARVFGWTSRTNGRVIEIHAAVVGAEPMFQIRDYNGPSDIEILSFPLTEAGLAEARTIARAKAQSNEM